MKTVYFVRHGSTPQLEIAAYQELGTPLSDLGRRQAGVSARRFADIRVEKIFSSSMRRAVETASVIAEAKGLVAEPVPFFNEILRPSAIRGKRRDDPEVARIYEETVRSFDDPSRRHSDEENFYDLKARAMAALEFLAGRAEEHIVVVTHGVFLKMLAATMMFGDALSARDFRGVERLFVPSNTGITKCLIREGKWRIVTWNDDAHLGELRA